MDTKAPNSAKRILFVNRFFYPDHSATSQILSDLAFDLAAEGVHVLVVTSRQRYDDAVAELPRTERIAGVEVHRVWSTSFGRAGLIGRALDYGTFYLGAGIALWKLADRRTIVVAETDPPLICLMATPVARLRGAQVVNWLQDLFPEVANALGMGAVRGPVLRVLRFARNLTLRLAGMNVVLGERMAAMVRGQGVGADRTCIIHNWADGDAIRPVLREGNPLRTAWGLEGKFIVAYSGNLGRAHEFNTIVGAAEQLAHRSDIAFLFIGAGAQVEAVRRQVSRCGLTNVLFKPYQPREQLKESLGVADLHLVTLNPALEGLIVPSKFYGIAAAGRPTLFIGDTAGEIPTILRDSSCGHAVRTGDVKALMKLIEQLADDPAACAAMQCNARDVFDRRFDRKIAVRAWKQVLGLN